MDGSQPLSREADGPSLALQAHRAKVQAQAQSLAGRYGVKLADHARYLGALAEAGVEMDYRAERREHVRSVMDECGGNKAEAFARLLREGA